MQDFHWKIPDLVFQSEEAQRGFLRGIFDAEGSVYIPDCCVSMRSKHKQNLPQIRDLLLKFGVKSRIQKSYSVLRIVSRGNCIRFQREIGFSYLPKKVKLSRICKVKYGPNIVNQAKELRESGLTYAEIAKRLGVTSESSIREWLYGEKLPPSVKYGWPVG